MFYTVEAYKSDRRTKKGEKLIFKKDYENTEKILIEAFCNMRYSEPGYRYEIHDTFVTKRNLISGVEFKERYDTPYYCSPSSETYWSM